VSGIPKWLALPSFIRLRRDFFNNFNSSILLGPLCLCGSFFSLKIAICGKKMAVNPDFKHV